MAETFHAAPTLDRCSGDGVKTGSANIADGAADRGGFVNFERFSQTRTGVAFQPLSGQVSDISFRDAA